MRIDLVSVASDPARPNEDFAAGVVPAAGVGGIAVVLDGVTPPADGDTGCAHGVPWFTARLGGGLLDLAGARGGLGLADCLANAIGRVAAAHPTCDLSHARSPQATVAAVRWDDEQVEYLVLSDAVVLLELVDGRVSPILDTRLEQVANRPEVRALRESWGALPEGSAERLATRQALGRAYQALRNVDGGFFTAAADPSTARFAVTGGYRRSQVRAAAVLSDGASRWTEVFRLGDWAGLFAILKKEGAESLVERVRAAEADDPEGKAFPRGKPFDDISIVHVEL